MSTLRIGQIGICHEHASGAMNALRRRPDLFAVVGVVDDRATTTAAHVRRDDLRPYEGLAWLSEEALLATPGLQAVVVETPNADLVPTALRCLARGLPMHMDKPGGEDLELFRRLRLGCEARGLPFQMGYMFRANPAIQWCLEAVRSGWLGEIFEVQGSMSHNYGDDDYHDYIGRLPGGLMFNLGCHIIDLAVAMLGRPAGVTPILKSAPGFPEAIRNHCLAILEYPHATATVRSCSLEVDGLPRRRLRICGTSGTAELAPLERFDGQKLALSLSLRHPAGGLAAGNHALEFGPQHDRYEGQFVALAEAIRGRRNALPFSAAHDILVQEVLLAASGCTTWKE